MPTKFYPLRDRVVVKRIEEKPKGLIIVPDQFKQKPQIGEIVAIGEGYIDEKGETIPLRVKKGQRILFGKYSGTDITLDDEELIIMREEDVLGIIEE